MPSKVYFLLIVGLADSLRNELLMYGMDVHIFLPATIFSPGFETENKTKPALTLEIEGAVDGVTSEKAAELLLLGILVSNGRFETQTLRNFN